MKILLTGSKRQKFENENVIIQKLQDTEIVNITGMEIMGHSNNSLY